MPNGPFQSCWIKLGFDPLSDPSSRRWQVLDYRNSFKNSKMHKVKTTVKVTDFIFDGTNKPPNFLQMCDIKIPQLRPLIDTEDLAFVLPCCYFNSGFFYHPVFKFIYSSVLKIFKNPLCLTSICDDAFVIPWEELKNDCNNYSVPIDPFVPNKRNLDLQVDLRDVDEEDLNEGHINDEYFEEPNSEVEGRNEQEMSDIENNTQMVDIENELNLLDIQLDDFNLEMLSSTSFKDESQ